MGRAVVIETRGLLKRYGRITAVAGVDLKVYEGEIFGFLGPNGAGKTTTCRILTTLTRPTAGRAFVSGCDVVRDPVGAKRGMGLVSQHLNVEPELSVEQNLVLQGLLQGMDRRVLTQRIGEVLEFSGLEGRRKELAGRLSGGLKRRLMIARALLHMPKVVFMDEPTVGLDAHARRRTWELIRQARAGGVSVFLTTHYIEEAEQLCDRVGVIHEGRLIALDTPHGLLARVGEVVVAPAKGGQSLFFPDRQSAARYVAQRQEDLVVRRSNLEDVFIALTGKSVQGGQR